MKNLLLLLLLLSCFARASNSTDFLEALEETSIPVEEDPLAHWEMCFYHPDLLEQSEKCFKGETLKDIKMWAETVRLNELNLHELEKQCGLAPLPKALFVERIERLERHFRLTPSSSKGLVLLKRIVRLVDIVIRGV